MNILQFLKLQSAMPDVAEYEDDDGKKRYAIVTVDANQGTGLTGQEVNIPDGQDVALGTTTDAAVVTNANGTVIGFLRGLVTLWLAGLKAGEAHIGEVGGNSEVITPTVAVTAASAYSAGNSIGGKLTLTNIIRSAGKPVILQHISILDASNQKPTGNLLIFNADPSAATITDKTAFAYSTDFTKQIARIPVTAADWSTINSKASCTLPNIGRVLKAASGTNLYMAFVTDATPTFGATTDIQITVGVLRD